MSGVAVIAELLASHDPLTAIVPVASMSAGRLSDGTVLPALLLTSISMADDNMLSPDDLIRTTERVQVMVQANTYRQQMQLLHLVRAACADRIGDFAGVTRVSVLTAGTGPDMISDDGSSIYARSQDFRVSYLRAR